MYPKALLLMACLITSLAGWAQEVTLQHLSTYRTGIFGQSAAEIVAYDKAGQRIFFVNAQAATVDVVDMSDPSNPVLVNSLDCTPYGGYANSVAVHSGIVAVAVESFTKTDDGRVVFFDTNGNYLNDVEAGPLPDMITFTHDGMKVLVANEGEPNDDYTIDPEGSVTIVDLSAGVMAATVTHVTFEAYNDRKMSLKNMGVRIFGNDGQASVAQDLEPEYITITADNKTAFVACQENNALAVIDIPSATLRDILPLGFKDHNRGTPIMREYLLNEIPWWNVFDLGKPVYGGETVKLGGFSGLYFDPVSSTDNQLSFWAIPDRGPNEDPVARALAGSATDLRPYKLPDYQARIVKLNYIKSLDMFFPDANQIFLKTLDGAPITGKGNVPGFDEIPVTRTDPVFYPNADYTVNGISYHQLPFDPLSGDFEGIVRTPDFHFWLCDENRPSIYHFDENGTLIERYVPEGTSLLGSDPKPAGFYGKETLPAVYNKRWSNRGFEAIAYDYDENIIYAFIQSPLDNPNSATVRNRTDIIRILGIDPATGQPVKEFVYLLERNKYSGVGISRVDKIGDAVYAGNGVFFVLERDSSTPDDGEVGKKFIYEIKTKHATNILGTPLSSKQTSSGPDDKTLEMMSADDLAEAGIVPVHKTKVLNLPSIGYLPSDKPEGLAILPNGDLVVLNDNDFGLAGAGVSDNSSIAFISFAGNYGFDASNTNPNIEIVPHPTLGIYMPDAIKSFQAGGQTYIITANEGDARDYAGYSEEARVNNLVLDPAYFPNAASLQQNANLGRLVTTLADGDLNQDGMNEIIYSFGARSFSIWDVFGNIVYDSADDFEQIIAQREPGQFNSTNNNNNSRKNRSDDKGPEPEAVEVAEINGELYAFIGLERQGGVMIYNISNPKAPYFVDFVNNRNYSAPADSPEAGDLGVEDIIFVAAADSPTGEALILTANEVSGTVSIFAITDASPRPGDRSAVAGSEQPREIFLEGAYPNPFTTHFNMTYLVENDGLVDIELFNTLGQKQSTLFRGEQPAGHYNMRFDANNSMQHGTYWVSVKQNGKLVKTYPMVKK